MRPVQPPLENGKAKISKALPDRLDLPRTGDRRVSCDQRQVEVARRRTNQRIERIAQCPQFACLKDLRRIEAMWLIGRIAEEIGEEASHRPVKVHSNCARQQCDFPDDDDRHVDNGVAFLGSRKKRPRTHAEPAAASSVKQQRVRVGNR